MTTAPHAALPTRPSSGTAPGRIVLTVIGALVGLIGLGLLAGGGGVLWANATQRDGEGFFVSAVSRFASSSYALAGEDIELTHGVSGWLSAPGDLATFRIRGSSVDGGALFVGIAPAADVRSYLRGVGHDEIVDVHMDGWKGPIRKTSVPQAGGPPASIPDGQGFWSAKASGRGEVSLTWPVREGTWAVVVMNADGSPGVAADLRLGVKVNFLGWVALCLLVGGSLLAIGGGVMVLFGLRTPSGGNAAAVSPPAVQGGVGATTADSEPYPVMVEADLDPGLSRWMWLVKWFLAIPHYVVLAFLWPAAVVLTVVAFFAILVTGRFPRGIFDFNVGVLRWTWRVAFYAYSVLGTDRYPPFTLADADYPARLTVPYPERLSRGLVLVKSWLLAIPHYLVLAVLLGNWGWAFADHFAAWGPSLNGILVLMGAVVLLFTGSYPREVFGLVVGINRWALRVAAYAMLMRDEYPPFRLDR